MKVYYNEFDPKAANWIRELVKAGVIPNGDVDERSISEVQPADLVGYTQCHFFAGIAGWSLALQLAGWPSERRIWTGSCPCQPFSGAGKRKGTADERHLWPEFYRLVSAGKPEVVAGEQVGGKLGYQWVAGVYADLEEAGYRVPRDENGGYEFYDLPAACVSSPHIRQRLFWVADASQSGAWPSERRLRQERDGRCEDDGRLANSIGNGAERNQSEYREWRRDHSDSSGLGQSFQSRLEGLCGHGNDGHESGRIAAVEGGSVAEAGTVGGVDVAESIGRRVCDTEDERSSHGEIDPLADSGNRESNQPPWVVIATPWDDFILIPCRDGKDRRVPESIVCGVADGISASVDDLRIACHANPLITEKVEGRVGLLKGYGNAIVPQVAAQFIRAYLESC